MGVVRFDRIARECRETHKGGFDGIPVVGLEHIEPYEMRLKNYDINVETTFTKRFHEGQILFGRRRAYQHKACVATCDGICSGDITVIEPIEGQVYPGLLPFIIQNDDFFEHAIKGSNGALSPRVKWEHMANFEVNLPSFAEQKLLAEKLWAAYEVKQSYLKMIKATREMVQSQFIEMFKDEYSTEKWQDCLSITNGKKFEGEYQEAGSFPICGSGGVMGYGERKLCDKDTIILGRKGNINSPIYMENDYWIVDTAFSLAVDRQKLQPKYFFFWCKQFDFTKYNKQGVLPSLTKNDLLKIEMPIPPMEQQTRFVFMLEQADKSEFELRKSIDAIDAVIKSLINS